MSSVLGVGNNTEKRRNQLLGALLMCIAFAYIVDFDKVITPTANSVTKSLQTGNEEYEDILRYQYGGKERVEMALNNLPPWVRDYVQCECVPSNCPQLG